MATRCLSTSSRKVASNLACSLKALTVVVPVMASLVKTVSCLQPTWQPPVVGEDGCLGGGLKPLQLTFATGEDNLESKEANKNGQESKD